jgi:hypothetical protein
MSSKDGEIIARRLPYKKVEQRDAKHFDFVGWTAAGTARQSDCRRATALARPPPRRYH